MISKYVLTNSSRASRAKGTSLSIPPSNYRGSRSNYIEPTADSAGSKRERTRASKAGSGISMSLPGRWDIRYPGFVSGDIEYQFSKTNRIVLCTTQ